MVNSLHKANFIIANSNFTKNLAIKLGVSENKIKIIYPGCNYPISIENKYTDKARELFRNAFPKIITVGRLEKRKGHDKVLMLMKEMNISNKKNIENLNKWLFVWYEKSPPSDEYIANILIIPITKIKKNKI